VQSANQDVIQRAALQSTNDEDLRAAVIPDGPQWESADSRHENDYGPPLDHPIESQTEVTEIEASELDEMERDADETQNSLRMADGRWQNSRAPRDANSRSRSPAKDGFSDSQSDPISVLDDNSVRRDSGELVESGLESNDREQMLPPVTDGRPRAGHDRGGLNGPTNMSPISQNDLRNPTPIQENNAAGSQEHLNQQSGDDESEQLDELDQSTDEEQEDDSENPLKRSCDEYREILDNPITEIALDISPPKHTIDAEVLSRSWLDQQGNTLAIGTLVDLRRGYVIIDTAQGRIKIPYFRLSEADWAAISENWRIPLECGVGARTFAGRCWNPQTVTWTASSLCHKPLYFENEQLERYGHSAGPFLQPIHSTAHFFSSIFWFPYHTSINPPNECQYALGYYRPGNCAPWLRNPIPISLSGAKRQAEVVTGTAFLFQ
jgi:hypothetical protein